MFTKEEVVKKLENAKSWRETGLTLDDVKAVLQGDNAEPSQQAQIIELREKVSKLTDTNKQLRAKIKQLEGR